MLSVESLINYSSLNIFQVEFKCVGAKDPSPGQSNLLLEREHKSPLLC